ncbi:polysaccharide biosynthesis protein [Spirochaetia bacterium]|nr:polysaccharide biosynthesis protein [Spirochaetia bacterium]
MKSGTLKNISSVLSFLGKGFTKLNLFVFSRLFFSLKDNLILDYLYRHYSDFIANWYGKYKEDVPKFKLPPIWVCWLQGEEFAPVVVKKCINSIRNHAGNHPVIIISEKNINEFVSMPDSIMDNVNNGIITRTGFSDILRAALLACYGGLWVDSTFYFSQDIPEEYFSYPIFSAGRQPEPWHRRMVCISHYRWTGSFLGTNSLNNILFCFLRDFFFEYEKRDGIFIDYLLIDYIIHIAYEKLPDVKKQIDNIPYNNIGLHKLFHAMNNKFNEIIARKMLLGDTKVFKLSYKRKWKDKASDGSYTFFHYFINGYSDIFR